MLELLAMRRPLNETEKAFVAANRASHIALNLPGLADLAGRAVVVAAVAAFYFLLFRVLWVCLLIAVGGIVLATLSWWRDRRVVIGRRTYWDPYPGVDAWEVEEDVLRVLGALTVAGPPEDYDTWLVLRLEDDEVFACRLTDLALSATELPQTVVEVAFSELRVCKLEPNGPGLPTQIEGDLVPHATLDYKAGEWEGPGKKRRFPLKRLPKWVREELPGA